MKKSHLSRRTLLKGSIAVAATVAATPASLPMFVSNVRSSTNLTTQITPLVGSRNVTNQKTPGSRARVYFTSHIDAEHLIRLYEQVNEHIYGKVAIKLHTGEKNGPNI